MRRDFLFIVLFFFSCSFVLAQNEINDNKYFFSGDINLNNNGVSWVPLFTLGKPSLIANFSIGSNRLSINPSFRYQLEGLLPWSIDIYWNYKFLDKEKLKIDIGGFLPGTTFQDFTYKKNEIESKILTPWVTAMINPKITFSINESFGLRFSYFIGVPLKIVDKENQFKSGEIFFIQPQLKKFGLNDNLNLVWKPEIYYLKLDDKSGIFSAQTLTVNINNSPISFSSVISKSIDIGTLSGNKFDWNIGINYSFNYNFTRLK